MTVIKPHQTTGAQKAGSAPACRVLIMPSGGKAITDDADDRQYCPKLEKALKC